MVRKLTKLPLIRTLPVDSIALKCLGPSRSKERIVLRVRAGKYDDEAMIAMGASDKC